MVEGEELDAAVYCRVEARTSVYWVRLCMVRARSLDLPWGSLTSAPLRNMFSENKTKKEEGINLRDSDASSTSLNRATSHLPSAFSSQQTPRPISPTPPEVSMYLPGTIYVRLLSADSICETALAFFVMKSP